MIKENKKVKKIPKCYKRQWEVGNTTFQFTINPEARRVFGVMTIVEEKQQPFFPPNLIALCSRRMGKTYAQQEYINQTIGVDFGNNVTPSISTTRVYKAGITCSKDDEWDPVVGISVCVARLMAMCYDTKGNAHEPGDQDGNGWHRFKEWCKRETRVTKVSEVDTVHDGRGVSDRGSEGERITVTPTRSVEEVQRGFTEASMSLRAGQPELNRDTCEKFGELVDDIKKAGEDIEEGVTGH